MNYEKDNGYHLLTILTCGLLVGCVGGKPAAAQETITSNFGGKCCEMEGAAIAQACYLNNTPFVVIRAISDKTDGTQAVEFETFEKEAAANCARAVLYMVKNL